MFQTIDLFGFLTLGLLGGFGHCVGMCSAFVLFVSRRYSPPGGGRLAVLAAQGWYTAGRVVTYAVLGAVAGALGSVVEMAGSLLGLQRGAAIVAGAVLVIWALLALSDVASRFGAGGKFFARIAAALKGRVPGHPFATGLILGLLPCGLLYSALIAAVARGGALQGAAALALFGLGTAVALFGVSVADELLARNPGRSSTGLAGVPAGDGPLVPVDGVHRTVMNLLLLAPGEIADDATALLTGRRHEHAQTVLRVQTGQTLRVGVRGGMCGTGEVVSEGPEGLRLRLTLDGKPPPRSGVSLVLAMPRPKALRRVIPAIASLGVDRVVLVNAARVEKSYFDSGILAPGVLDGLIDLGLEQARDTRPPVIAIRDRFRPFVEDELDAWAGASLRLLPHPPAEAPLPRVAATQPVVIAVGPDGGWVPFEVDLLGRCGFVPVSLGPRVLRVEVAVSYLIGRVR